MKTIKLIPLHLSYAKEIHRLSQAPEVKSALGLPTQSVEDTENFIINTLIEESEGKSVSRIILNEEERLVGITTLMFIDHFKKHCHIGSWIGFDYWGQGYNLPAKIEILKIAFEQLQLNVVFAGARTVNIRSQKAQEKLPFISLNVEKEFCEEHSLLEQRQKQPCVLNAVFKEDFAKYLQVK
ncbi:GNAT family N-acetyltransferase [Solibacillus silvestris]|uniref:GNAT family N-acetyltransferase n=1 Tax=Solibacillus silvestris TaxID=76853 RepID=UPI003F7FFA1E